MSPECLREALAGLADHQEDFEQSLRRGAVAMEEIIAFGAEGMATLPDQVVRELMTREPPFVAGLLRTTRAMEHYTTTLRQVRAMFVRRHAQLTGNHHGDGGDQ